MNEVDIQSKFQSLSPELKKEVLDYIDFLISRNKNKKQKTKKLTFEWQGKLSDLKEEFTSVELQHKALEWR
ncbi:MAG: hypothetical protein APG12_01146 [Candidatus Methanofastidiosum methylothiophilum]|uniref:DUF2281 domain-containing protein n=1 Tax=Candidatus Methanofastidiosum methylothiophilum TaxID=1705564 RepID=A0A150IUA7_9EURY|nr:MAG: hypothetical protein APG11_00262 [Candidatus Methanofastidiosum methylthiophilus]KYC49897.1 MAG: hypothetical protein APG12_01146 [Candidatus Methanofastidiosum methylthiophilus]NPV50441.1 DUF2281 domain-containing protein [Methanofastidiosum sp.]HII94607.1 DUF2281 domain-containing protein [Methanofastidiosum sp.]